MPAKVDDLALRIEALLFAAGKPLTVKELAEAAEVPDFRQVQAALRLLDRAYAGRQTSLEIRRVGEKYALQLRSEFVPAAHPVAAMELPPRTLKALTLIAYHQPILQSALARMIGDAAYEEVGRLRAAGLVHAEPSASTLALRTTRAFSEYFGLDSTRPDEIRRVLERRLGVTPGPPPGARITSDPLPSETTDDDGSTAPPPAEPPTPTP